MFHKVEQLQQNDYFSTFRNDIINLEPKWEECQVLKLLFLFFLVNILTGK